MKVYKLTNSDDCTHGGTQWGPNVTHRRYASGRCEPCTSRAVHAYTHPLMAAFCDPIHGGYGPEAHLWSAEMHVAGTDGLKVWGKQLTTIERVPLPVLTTEQRVEIAIRCSLTQPQPHKYVAWAEGWLDGSDRTAAAARAAWAVEAAWAARAARAARAAVEAAEAVEAAWAVEAAEAVGDIDLLAIIQEVAKR